MHARKIIAAITAAITISALTIFGLAAQASDAQYDGYIVKLSETPRRSSLSALANDCLEPVPYSDDLYLTDDLDSIKSLIDSGLVEYVEPNYILEPLDDGSESYPNDPQYHGQWTLDAIKYLRLYGGGFDGNGVTIAIIDSGLYAWYDETGTYHGHEEFEGSNISEYSKNFLGTADEDERSACYYRDQRAVGHGTFVTSQIAALTDNGKGMAGIADGAELMILRCISYSGSDVFPYDNKYDSNSGSAALVASAIRYAADNGADVINMSLGAKSSTNISTLQDAINYAGDKGVIVVAAAGNDGTSSLFYPAACEHVIGVGSVSRSGVSLTRSSFSQYNASISVTAPGGFVLGASVYPNADGTLYSSPEDSYITSSGTSYASPVVAALAAITKSINSELDHDDFESLLAVTSSDLGTSGWDSSYGYGILDAEALLTALTETEYGIDYQLCGSVDAPAQLPAGSAATYTLGRDEDLTLPTPTRSGYDFEGWYETGDYSGEAVTALPLGALGTVRSSVSDKTVSYYIEDIKYYAKWSELTSAEITSLKVLGYEAVPSQDVPSTYTITLPSSAIDSLANLTSDGIAVTLSYPITPAISKVSEDGSFWSIVLPTLPSQTVYDLNITHSAYDVPSVTEGSASQSGTALLPSLDELKAANVYTANISTWFEQETSYQIVSSDGAGEVKIEGTILTYTPDSTKGPGSDYEGRAVTILLKAKNDMFESKDAVTVTVTVGRNTSNSVIDPVSGSYDLYTDSGGISVVATLYGNSFTGLYYNESPVSQSSYTTAPTDSDGDDLVDSITVTISRSFINSLSTGIKSLTFRFSAGKDKTFALTISDSAGNGGGGGGATGGGGASAARDETILERLPPGTVSYSDDDISEMISGNGDNISLRGSGDNGVSLSGKAASRIAKAKTDVVIFNSNGSISLPWETFSPGLGDNEQLYLALTSYSSEGLQENEIGSSHIVKCLELKALVYTNEVFPEAVTAFEAQAGVTLFVGAEYSGQNFKVLAIANGASNTALEAVSNSEGYITLTTGVPAVFAVLTQPQFTAFTDVKSGDWYYSDVEYVFSKGLMKGVAEGLFGPGATATRAMLATTAYRMAGSPAVIGSADFTDLSTDMWYTAAITWASAKGILGGYGGGVFGTDDPITRQQLALLLWRYAGSPEVKGGLTAFPDGDSASDYAVDALIWATQKGIITGKGDGILDPAGLATRAEVAAMLARFDAAISG